ncbi:uncharacterized protein TRIADDRAFT_57417 [Trichoplax adhaerens]|uniref:Uncharacterized protein n=1 Tax=Trichoplax adhaerens TaxID=10228 RepID=B3RZE0_TRIAD|nr:hypothetical protein TRIADDRAFT_57417 [Trichoplax adhaerens]EDV23827.1 hypothetical protein TRIADDRAFT_57417 [Trichoplax adhaerens]|eukprot:XP_002113353.1 hypothetical protein TRIADDRAFT_57417 [Trichoplax adhaerens]
MALIDHNVPVYYTYKPLDSQRRSWQRPPSNIVRLTNTVRNRYKDSACYYKDSVYIFGGISMSDQTAFNDLHRFDLRNRCWSNSTLITKGTKPLPRGSASMVRHDYRLILFGGYCPSTHHLAHNDFSELYRFYNDLFVYDPLTSTWTEIKITPCNIPQERASHSAVVIGHSMIIFGGISKRTSFNDVWILDLRTFTWQQLKIDGITPCPRGGHSQIVVDEKRIAIIGGQKRLGEHFESLTDIWLLDIVQQRWQKIKVINENWMAPDIWYHPAVKINNIVVIFSNLISTLSAGVNAVNNTFNFDVTLNSISNLHMFILDFSNLQNEKVTFEVTWRQPIALPVTSNKAHCSVLCRSEIFLFSSSNEETLYIIS